MSFAFMISPDGITFAGGNDITDNMYGIYNEQTFDTRLNPAPYGDKAYDGTYHVVKVRVVGNDATVSIVLENLNGISMTTEDYVKTVRNLLREQYANTGHTVDMTDPMSIGLANYYWQEFDMELNGGTLYQRMMVTEKDGYMISITFTAMDSSELNRLARSLTFFM